VRSRFIRLKAPTEARPKPIVQISGIHHGRVWCPEREMIVMANARPMSAVNPYSPATTIQRRSSARTVTRASPPAARRTLASSAGVPPDESPMGGGTGVRMLSFGAGRLTLDCVLSYRDGVRHPPGVLGHLGATFETCPRARPAPPLPASVVRRLRRCPSLDRRSDADRCASDRGSALDAVAEVHDTVAEPVLFQQLQLDAGGAGNAGFPSPTSTG